MIRVSNRRRVRRLGRQAMGAAKTRNVIAVVAIALTTVLFTSLFTIVLSINDGFQEANFRQAGGYAHGTFKSLTLDQVDALKEDPLVEDYGLRRVLGLPTQEPFQKTHVEVAYSDANNAQWTYATPTTGTLPQEGTDQAATDTHVLELLGVEPKIGAKFTLTFDVDGHTTTQTFTLSGWWERDEAIVASHVLIPESRVDAVLDEVGVTPPGSNGMIGALGLMPFLPDYPVVEVYPGVPCPAYATKGRFVIHSSDAHRLEDIQERIFSLDTHPTARDVMRLLRALDSRQMPQNGI